MSRKIGKNCRRIVLIYPDSASADDVRLGKLTRALGERRQLEVWEWDRGDVTDRQHMTGYARRVILMGGGRRSTKTHLYYLLFVWRVALSIVKDARRGDMLWCVGLYAALPAIALRGLRGTPVIFDDPDRMSLLFNPGALRRVIQALELLAFRLADDVIVPGPSRYGNTSGKFHFLRNTPSSDDVSAATTLRLNKPDGFVVYINGWLPPSRGIGQIAAAIDLLASEKVHFVVAGRSSDIEMYPQFQSDNCTVLGKISAAESLAWYGASDLVCALYDPAIEINVFAEPNKVGDAIVMGTPLLMNKGVRVAEELDEKGAAFLCDYGDAQSFAQAVRTAMSPAARASAISALAKLRAFDTPFNERIGVLLDSEL